MIFETISDGLSLSLNSVVVNVYDLDKLLQSHISNIVLFVRQEATKDIDPENSETLS